MNNQEVVIKAESLLEPALAVLEIEIVDVEYRREQGRWVFRVFIDHEDGVDHDKCQQASGLIGEVLEKNQLIENAYVLEVSSPGLDRIIKKDRDFARFSEQKVKLKSFEAINGQKNFTGILKGLQDDQVKLEIGGNIVLIPRNNVRQVRLVVEL